MAPKIFNFAVIAQLRNGKNSFRSQITKAESANQALEMLQLELPDFEVIELKRLDVIEIGRLN